MNIKVTAFTVSKKFFYKNIHTEHSIDLVKDYLSTSLSVYISCFAGLQIYGGPGSLSHDFKIWPITFEGSGPSGPILISCEKISLK